MAMRFPPPPPSLPIVSVAEHCSAVGFLPLSSRMLTNRSRSQVEGTESGQRVICREVNMSVKVAIENDEVWPNPIELFFTGLPTEGGRASGELRRIKDVCEIFDITEKHSIMECRYAVST